MSKTIVGIITILVLVYFGNVLHVALLAGHYWVIPASLVGIFALGYAVATPPEKQEFREAGAAVARFLRLRR